MEADLIQLPAEGSPAAALGTKTVYGIYQLREPHLSFDLLNMSAAWSEIDESGRITCRISYAGKAKPSTNDLSNLESLEDLQIYCGFCLNPLIQTRAIKAVKPMATGLFDNVCSRISDLVARLYYVFR